MILETGKFYVTKDRTILDPIEKLDDVEPKWFAFWRMGPNKWFSAWWFSDGESATGQFNLDIEREASVEELWQPQNQWDF